MPIDEEGWALWVGDIEDAIESEVVDEYVAESKRRAPFKTGYLRESIRKIKVGSGHWKVIVSAPYWAPLEYGSRPHAIPNAFGYGPNFGTSPTFHPGNRAYGFMRMPLMKTRTFR